MSSMHIPNSWLKSSLENNHEPSFQLKIYVATQRYPEKDNQCGHNKHNM